MKISSFSPKRLFLSKKSPKLSRSDPSSSTSSSSDSFYGKSVTPKSILLSNDNISSNFSSELVNALKLIDRDNDGRISRRNKETRSNLPANDISSDLPRDDKISSRDRSVETTSILPANDNFLSELVHAFRLIDRDNDGKISRQDLETLLNQIAPSRAEVESMISEVDLDGDGCIRFEEFCLIGSAFEPASNLSELRETFEFFDTDRDGKISAEELLNVFVSIGDDRCTLEDCKFMIAEVDVNGGGFVCFEDFTRMMEPLI